MKFNEVSVNPLTDLPLLNLKMDKSSAGNTCKEYNTWVERFNTEMRHRASTEKNNWKQIENLVLSRNTRDQVMEKKREYNDLRALQKLKRTNMPFSYIQSDHVHKLRKLNKRVKKPHLKKEVEQNLQTFERIYDKYKQLNPHLFK